MLVVRGGGGVFTAASFVVLSACSEKMTSAPRRDERHDGTNGTSDTPGRAQDDGCQTAPVATPRRVRLLSRGEYLSVAANLLGPKAHDRSDLVPEDVRIRGVDNPADAVSVTPGRLDGYAAFAEKAAAAADVSALAPCTTEQSVDDCAVTFVRQFGRRAFGRPLDDAEVGRFTEVFRIGREGQDYPAGIRLVIEALLQSPGFLYALELGEGDPPAGDETVRLTDHELASRLSFTLSGSRPDDQLLEAADQGALRDPAQLRLPGRTDPGPARRHHAPAQSHVRVAGVARSLHRAEGRGSVSGVHARRSGGDGRGGRTLRGPGALAGQRDPVRAVHCHGPVRAGGPATHLRPGPAGGGRRGRPEPARSRAPPGHPVAARAADGAVGAAALASDCPRSVRPATTAVPGASTSPAGRGHASNRCGRCHPDNPGEIRAAFVRPNLSRVSSDLRSDRVRTGTDGRHWPLPGNRGRLAGGLVRGTDRVGRGRPVHGTGENSTIASPRARRCATASPARCSGSSRPAPKSSADRCERRWIEGEMASQRRPNTGAAHLDRGTAELLGHDESSVSRQRGVRCKRSFHGEICSRRRAARCWFRDW